jgi:hypothetical protein
MTIMQPFRVTWAIDVEAGTAHSAARRARIAGLKTWCVQVERRDLQTGEIIRETKIDLGTIGSPDGEVQRDRDKLLVLFRGRLFPVLSIYGITAREAHALHTPGDMWAGEGQPILAIRDIPGFF